MLSSVARNILPTTRKFFHNFPNIEINVLEVAPAEAIIYFTQDN